MQCIVNTCITINSILLKKKKEHSITDVISEIIICEKNFVKIYVFFFNEYNNFRENICFQKICLKFSIIFSLGEIPLYRLFHKIGTSL